jgi:two-component system, OmpR family, alkaline phosphatase synthesis response regulator PhoP
LSETISSGGLMADRRSRRAFVRRSGKWVEAGPLRAREFELLCLFLEREGEALERSLLLEALWGKKAGHDSPDAVDRQVVSLRKKLGAEGGRIAAVYGTGYLLRKL